MNKKELYLVPETEVLELRLGSTILQTSGGNEDFDSSDGNW